MACSSGGSTWPCPRFQSNINAAVIQSQCHTMTNAMFSCGTFSLSPVPEMGSELPGPVTMPGAVVGAGQVRMGGAMPGRGGKRRSGGWVLFYICILPTRLFHWCSRSITPVYQEFSMFIPEPNINRIASLFQWAELQAWVAKTQSKHTGQYSNVEFQRSFISRTE